MSIFMRIRWGERVTKEEFDTAKNEIDDAMKIPSVRELFSRQEKTIEDLEFRIDSLKEQRFRFLTVLILSISANLVSICSLLMIIQR